ncbi:MAG: UDP-N-acetylglucosamine 2-epimerase (non-hydrolyzing) [Candidatus ainarchaeum sp.]|nr:UDP-N-acetylglucosamine 2-epimerase (non-hydrolyzing) [Candidatus ainarchaeum sp.]
MKVFFVFGTRPEFIKLFPLIKEAKERGHELKIIHTGQHFSFDMSELILNELNICVDINLGISALSRTKQISMMLEKLNELFLIDLPDIVFAQGDTNSVVSAALASNFLGVKFAHVEAGIRSFDRNMPEEVNRVLVDQISDYLFAPTLESKKNLMNSETNKKGIFVVGNTIVDSLLISKELSKKSNILKSLGINEGNYCVLTMHRSENVDDKEKLESVLNALKESKELFIFPIHPRTKKNMEKFGLENYFKLNNVKFIAPLGFFDFLNLCSNSKLILTDSGGIQEEASIYKKPVVVIRENTERPEIIGSFSMLVGTNKEKIIAGLNKMSDKDLSKFDCPYGDGLTSKKIMDIIEEGLY